MEKLLLTMQETAELLGLSYNYFRQLHSDGKGPPCVKVGKQAKFRKEAIEEWLKDKEKEEKEDD